MAELGCTSGCSCHASEDGYWANDPLKGRRNTVVEGTGTPSDPWTISFIDSAQYRPVAGEILYPDIVLNAFRVLDGTNTTFSYRTSPGSPARFVGHSAPGSLNINITGNYFVVGAAAEFQANADSGSKKALIIRTSHATLGSIIIAGAVTAGLTTEDMILTTSGYNPGIFALGTQAFNIELRETATGTLNVKKLKFWATTI